jgi:hypothetical protein
VSARPVLAAAAGRRPSVRLAAASLARAPPTAALADEACLLELVERIHDLSSGEKAAADEVEQCKATFRRVQHAQHQFSGPAGR